MGGKPMNTADYDKIVTDRLVFGKPAKQIAEEIGRKDSSVFSVVSAFNAVKDQDWNRCIALVTNQGLPLSIMSWAGERLGIEIPPSVAAAYEERKKAAAQLSRKAYAKQKGKETPPPVEAPPPARGEERGQHSPLSFGTAQGRKGGQRASFSAHGCSHPEVRS